LVDSLKGDQRLTCEIVWLNKAHRERALSLEETSGHCAVFATDTLFLPTLITEVAQGALPEETWTVKGGEEGVFWLFSLCQSQRHAKKEGSYG
jgi:hypothetical protein